MSRSLDRAEDQRRPAARGAQTLDAEALFLVQGWIAETDSPG